MTVPAQTPINESEANGVTTVFPYTFLVTAASELLVQVDGVTKTLSVDYTVTGVGNNSGGNVTFTVAPANGATVTRRRNMPLERNTGYTTSGDLKASVLNNDHDRHWLALQQLQAQIGKSIQMPPGITGGALPTPTPLAPLVWNASGTALENGDLSLVGDMLLRPALASTSTGLGLALSGTAAGAALNQATTGQHFGQNGARIHRLNDRLLMGAATANDGLFPNVAKDWLTTYQESIGLSAGTILSAQFGILSGTEPNSAVPILAGVQSQFFNAPGTTGLGVAAYALANNATHNNDMWAFYGEARRAAGVNSEVYGMELDPSALSATIAASPYTYGDVGALVLAAGGEYPLAGQFDLSFAIQISGNPAKFKQGIIFRNDALTDLGGGVKEAIALPSGAIIRNWTGAGAPGSFIYFATTTAAGSPSLQLGNGNFNVLETTAGAEQFRVTVTTAAVNYLNAKSSTTGNALELAAGGTDTNVDINIAPKGTGRLGVSYAATTATTPASFSATRIVPVKCNGTLIYLAGSTATW